MLQTPGLASESTKISTELLEIVEQFTGELAKNEPQTNLEYNQNMIQEENGVDNGEMDQDMLGKRDFEDNGDIEMQPEKVVV